MLLLLAGLGWYLLTLIRGYFWENALSATVVLGLLAILAYGWWDFPFQCPAILITWLALWSAIVIWTHFEEQNVKG